ncbi:MAG: YidC/Oxa1 family membrane protein insertase [Anaplasmataceae bacterium]|nr:YidC/Oxa1 family membrane protein insertase [Anaplasmataceae bacterium]
MIFLYDTLIYNPLLNAFLYIYQYLGDFGLTIIAITGLLRLILYPIFKKSSEQQVYMQRLQPEMEAIRKKYADNREEQTKATLELFRKHQVNPFAGFFLLFVVQLPILIAFYQIILHVFEGIDIERLYVGIAAPLTLNPYFIGLINLEGKSIVMLLVAAASTLILTITADSRNWHRLKTEFTKHAGKWLIGPILTLLFLQYLIPQAHNAIALYWVATSFFSGVQQYFINRKIDIEKKFDVA